MTHRHPSTTRRTVLTTLAAGSVGLLAGCTDSQSGSPADDRAAQPAVSVDGTELAVEFAGASAATSLAVIDPAGEAFAERSLTPGATRETIALGTAYTPGEYTVQLLADDDVVAETTHSIRPDIRLTDLKLARNHPDEMYDEAEEQVIRTETILSVENYGTGPERLTGVDFNGYVPRPTPAESEKSGLVYVDDGPITQSEPVFEPGELMVLYSRVLPFSSTSQEVQCTSEGTTGEFNVSLSGAVSEEPTSQSYSVSYTGEDLLSCEITIEPVGS